MNEETKKLILRYIDLPLEILKNKIFITNNSIYFYSAKAKKLDGVREEVERKLMSLEDQIECYEELLEHFEIERGRVEDGIFLTDKVVECARDRAKKFMKKEVFDEGEVN